MRLARGYADDMSTGDQSTPEPGQYPPPSGYPAGFEPYPGPVGPVGPVAVTAEERNWALAAHLSAIVGAWIFLGFIGPLVVLLIQSDRSRFVREHTVEALNFNLSVLIYSIVGWVLLFVLIGVVVLGALGILWLVCTILAIVKASNGEPYRYPLTIRLVH